MKKKITSLVLVLSMSVCGLTFNNNVEAARGEAIDMNGWKVQWSEEFDGNSLNKNTWNVEVNGYGGWNNELQYYNGDADTIKVNNGTLKITANKKNVTGIDENGQTKQYNYTSGRINTENKITLGNGRIEAKIKLPIFNGTFPAFWLMGGNGLRWPECGEIDIMEAVNTENVAYGTAHWPKKVGTFSDDINSLSNGTYGWGLNLSQWHTYGVERTDTYIKWYVDNEVYHTVDLTSDAANKAPLKLDAYVILNLAIGGEWPGYNIDNNAFPATMEVDYVRYYVKDNNAPTVQPTTQALTQQTTTATQVVNGTEVLKNTAFNSGSNWEENSANNATFTNNGNGSLNVTVPAYNSGNAWDTQLVQTPISLDSSKYYVATYTVSSDVDKTFMFLAQKTDYSAEDATVLTDVKAGETKVVKTMFKPSESRDYLYGIMMGYVNNKSSNKANVKISNVSMKVYNTKEAAQAALDNIKEIETTVKPTTQAPTTQAPTTQAPTTQQVTTQQPTTQAPTTQQVTTQEVTTKKAAPKASIKGFQISTTLGGFRTLYKIEKSDEISKVGLIYAIKNKSKDAELTLNANNPYIKAFEATAAGKNQALSDDKYDMYTMTMLFGGSTSFLSEQLAMRPYIILKDGTVIYGEIKTNSVYDIASYLYDGSLMSNSNNHEYLYNNILSLVNPNYAKKKFDINNTVVLP